MNHLPHLSRQALTLGDTDSIKKKFINNKAVDNFLIEKILRR
jgi:hypothetical protein